MSNCDVMSNITHWSMAIRDVLLAIQRVLQVQAYENVQKKDTPSNLSTDLLLVIRMLERGMKSKDILGAKVEKVCAILTKLVPLISAHYEVAAKLEQHLEEYKGRSKDWRP